ncbi:MAG: mucoidy inhibitor MuiA family protein [Chloroflexota bacterium]|nr:mucoidy inhibitor MuiA family protein [Chloroflexota bacterium]
MTPLDAPIVAVTVYTDRARVTREGTVHLEPGTHTILLAGLPAALDPDSVRAGGRGAGLRLLGVEVASTLLPSAPEADLAALRDGIEQLQEADRALADAEVGQTARRDFLDHLRAAGGPALGKGLARGSITLDGVAALVGYNDRELAATQARLRELVAQRRALARELAARTARLHQVAPQESLVRRAIQVTVEADSAGDLALEVQYAVQGAGWQPLYDLRLVGERVELTYLAQVCQQTGEDWPAVPLTLSTARPAVSATLPELDPWYIDTYRPPLQARAFRVPAPMQAAASGGAGFNDAPRDQARPTTELPATPPPPPVEIAEATIAQSGAAVTYRVARPVAVPSDGAPHKVTVTTLDLAADLDYVTVPKLAAEAYLRAKVTNASAFTLLPGAAGIFHEADFVGTTRLSTVAPSETFEVQLGIDDRVKVERDLTERTAGKSAFIGNLKRVGWAYRIRLTNHLPTPARITVTDQLPVPRHEDIKVKLQEAMPKPTEQTALQLFSWTLVLPAGAQREILLAFTVEHPRTLLVTGLEA